MIVNTVHVGVAITHAYAVITFRYAVVDVVISVAVVAYVVVFFVDGTRVAVCVYAECTCATNVVVVVVTMLLCILFTVMLLTLFQLLAVFDALYCCF